MIQTDNDAFFSVDYAIAVNILPAEPQQVPSSQAQFESEIPAPFLIATEHASLEAESLHHLRKLGEQYQEITHFLNLQSKKIDLLMGYLLALQDQPEHRKMSTSFGAGGLCYETRTPPEVNSHLQLKLFLHDESSAVYCYGQVIQVEAKTTATPTEATYRVKVNYTYIREQDRELLIRASLHIQSRQLKTRSENLLAKQRKHTQ